MPRPLPSDVMAATHGDIDAVRGHILDAAHRVITNEGLTAASTRAIATEAGLGAGTIYNYFDNRLELLARAILRRAHLLSQPLADLSARAGSETVAINLQHHATQVAEILAELVPLFAAAFSDPDLLTALHHDLKNGDRAEGPFVGGPVERYLLAELDLGRVAPDADCEAAASLLAALCHDRAFHAFIRGETVDTNSLTQEIQLIAHGVTTPTGPGHEAIERDQT